MTVFVDPDMPAPHPAAHHLRRRLGRTHKPALGEAVRRLHAGATGRSLQALRPGGCSRAHRQGRDGEAARFVEAPLHPLLPVEGPDLQDYSRSRLLRGGDALRRPQASHVLPVGHLTTGIAYAFPWHRDVWYSAPAQQINWWLPVFAAREDNSMRFDLQSFDRYVCNSSGTFDYYKNNADRRNTAAQVTRESQARPAALEYQPHHDLVVLPAPGAVLLFSGAQLHASIPNTSRRSRFSVDFRTVDVQDLKEGRGAPLVDVHCTGTAIRDFHNVADGSAFDEETVIRLFGAPPPGSMLLFEPARSELGQAR